MNIRRLECFVALAECLNFTAAAKRVYIGQSALSQQIAALEDELGVKLFDRTKHSVRLTAAGEILQAESRAIFQRIEQAVEKVRMASSGSAGSLKIGFLALVASQFLPDIAAEFLRRHSRIDLSLLPLYQATIQEQLANGKIDIAFARNAGLEGPLFVRKTIMTDRLSVVVRHDHPLARQGKVRFAALAREPFVAYPREVSPQLWDRILRFCANAGFTPNVVKQAPRVESLLFMIEAGIGIGVINRRIEQLCTKQDLAFLDIEGEEDVGNDLVIAWRTDNRNPAVAQFVQEFDLIYPSLRM